MKRSTFLLAAAATISLGVGASWGLARALRGPASQVTSGSHTLWAFKTDNLGEMARYADAVIEARHQRRYLGRTGYTTNGELAMQYELNDFVLTAAPIKGAQAGSFVTVERHAGMQDDGGTFEVGERYLLFLRKQEAADFYVQLNDEARFLLAPTGRLGSVAEGGVAASLRGRRLEEARSLVRESLGTP